jgi:hypothetical protein
MQRPAATPTECSFRVIQALGCLRVPTMRGTALLMSFGAASHIALGLRESIGEVPHGVPQTTWGTRNVRGRKTGGRGREPALLEHHAAPRAEPAKTRHDVVAVDIQTGHPVADLLHCCLLPDG